MIGRFKDLLRPGGARPDRLEQAAAALLVQVAALDGPVGQAERDRILALLETRFAMTAEAAAALLAAASEEVREAIDLYAFIRVINDSFPPEERVEMVEMLWEVAYADGRLDDYEANLLRRVSGLLFVPDRESGEARKRALARLGLEGSLA